MLPCFLRMIKHRENLCLSRAPSLQMPSLKFYGEGFLVYIFALHKVELWWKGYQIQFLFLILFFQLTHIDSVAWHCMIKVKSFMLNINLILVASEECDLSFTYFEFLVDMWKEFFYSCVTSHVPHVCRPFLLYLCIIVMVNTVSCTYLFVPNLVMYMK